MNSRPIRHFSSRFCLDLNKIPCKAVDRYSVWTALIFFLLASVLVFVGVYEFLNGARLTDSEVAEFMKKEGLTAPIPLMSPTFFDVIIVIMGLGLAFSMILAVIRYKKINFDGDFVRIIIRPALSSKIRITEPLYLYEGVRLRTEFLQFGLINRTKYIIELLHKDDLKTIPLYISMSGKNIRKIWGNYAKELHLPAIMTSDSGAVVKHYNDLDLPLKELILSGKIPYPAKVDATKPKSLWVAEKNGNIIIKIKHFLFDAYNIIAGFILAGFAAAVFFIYDQHEDLSLYFSENALYAVYITSSLFILYCLFIVSKRDKLIIKPDKVVLFHRFVFFNIKSEEIFKDKIEEVDVVCNPASGRSFIEIISADKSIIIGKKMPLADLRWLKQYIINELIK